MFNFIDNYSFIPLNGCVDMGPSALHCPVAYNAVKTVLSTKQSYRINRHHYYLKDHKMTISQFRPYQ